MLDINFVRENVNDVKENLRKRQVPSYLSSVDEVLKKDEIWRSLKGKLDEVRARRNQVSQEINAAKKEGKDAALLIKEAAEIPKLIDEAETELKALQQDIRSLLMGIPNMLDKDVPIGKDDSENVVVKTIGKKPKFDFEPVSHVDLMAKNNWVDLERAAKISGARWYFLKGDLAILEMALSRYAVDFMRERGFELVVPPYMMRKHAYEGVVSMEDFEEVMYNVEGKIEGEKEEGELYAIATSEHPLTAMYMNEVLDSRKLPLKLVGYSTNFRKEAGTHGKDQKGIFRVHQFNKVEQILICKPEESWDFHEEMIKNAMDFFESLGFHFNVVNVCTGDLGSIAAKKYDVEAWYPVQGAFREVVSCSNCESYQAVRLNLKVEEKGKRCYAHTLNGTCVATSRALVGIMENFQNKDGSVNVPEVLHKYTGFKVMGKK